MKRLLLLLLTVSLLLGCFSVAGLAQNVSGEKLQVIYIPIDDRPFNDERMVLMAESLGVKLIMPDKSWYQTVLDGQRDTGYACGDRGKLLQWLMDNQNQADVMILSLDQLLSGGLLNSRCMEVMTSVTLPDGTVFTEMEIIDYLAALAGEKEIYLLDSVMRLAASFGIAGFTIQDYNITRMYGMVARPALTGEQLTIENIVDHYRLAADGTQAYLSAGLTEEQIAYLLGNQTIMPNSAVDAAAVWDYIQGIDPEYEPMTQAVLMTVEEEMVEAEESLLKTYLNIRARKLHLTSYALETLTALPNVHYLLGVDDSHQGEQIQSNEIRYFQQYLSGDDQLISAMDGLGQMALSKCYQESLGCQGVSVGITYFGYCKYTINDFNFMSNAENVTQLLSYYGCSETEENPDISVLIYCGASLDGVRNADLYKLVSQLNENQEKQIPTILVDVSASPRSLLSILPMDQVQLGLLLSYSGKAEGPGQVHMAIHQGLARYFSLQDSGYLTEENHTAHLENLLSALAEEQYDTSSVNQSMYQYIQNLGLSDPMQKVTDAELTSILGEMNTQMGSAMEPLLTNFTSSNFITSLAPYTLSGITAASAEGFYYPWLRQFEIWGQYSCGYDTAVHTTGELHLRTVEGVSWTEFQPDAILTREQAAKLLMTFSQTPVDETVSSPFADVADWAYIYVANAAQRGYILGCDDGTFQGQRDMTRAEFAAMLYQYAAAENLTLEPVESITFTDVDSEGQWYSEGVYALAEAGVIKGFTDGSFMPEATITRAETVTMLSRLFDRDESLAESLLTLPRYVDVPAEHWACEIIQEASVSHYCKID